jgi:hypothetical protein
LTGLFATDILLFARAPEPFAPRSIVFSEQPGLADTVTVDDRQRDQEALAIVPRLRSLAARALTRMYCKELQLFAHHLQRTEDGQMVQEGVSRRYTAIVLIGLADETDDLVVEVLDGDEALSVCQRLLDDVEHVDALGDIALTLWAARALRHPDAGEAAALLRARLGDRQPVRTVELAWALSALAVDGGEVDVGDAADRVAARLLKLFQDRSGLFGIGEPGEQSLAVRPFPHVTSFADQAYAIHALSQHYRSSGNAAALATAQQCAARLCRLQGRAGQWYWHYDVRSGRVVERYPIYSVHQDAIGPMALLACGEAGDEDYGGAVAKGMGWILRPPETNEPLIDWDGSVIWRKVARREPGKLIRGLQALASKLHYRLRAPLVEAFFPPGAVDYECRPYHMGWILHAWSDERARQFSG